MDDVANYQAQAPIKLLEGSSSANTKRNSDESICEVALKIKIKIICEAEMRSDTWEWLDAYKKVTKLNKVKKKTIDEIKIHGKSL